MRRWLGEALVHASQSQAKTALAIVASALVAGLLELLVMFSLPLLRVSVRARNFIDAAVMAALGAVIAWLVLTGIRERRQAVLEQIKVAAELNRNVRAALGAILAEQYLPDQEQTSLLIESADRIDQTLKTLFPSITHPPQATLIERTMRQEMILKTELDKLTQPNHQAEIRSGK